MRSLNLIDKAFLLKKTNLFGSLDLDLLLSIADKVESLHFRAADKVFQIDHEGSRMYLIAAGQISIVDKYEQPLANLAAGDFFGDEGIFNDKRRTYSAYCLTKVELLVLPRSHLISIIQECPTVALCLLEAYASQFTCRYPSLNPL